MSEKTETVKEVKEITTKTGKQMFYVNCESGNSYSTFNEDVKTIIKSPGIYKIFFEQKGSFLNFKDAEFIKAADKEIEFGDKPKATVDFEDLKKKMRESIDTVYSQVLNQKIGEEYTAYLLQNAPSMVNTLFMAATGRK